MKRIFLNVLCVVLVIASFITIIKYKHQLKLNTEKYNDGIELTEPNKLTFEDGKVEVELVSLILSQKEETRKLEVYTQEATATYKLSENIIKMINAKANTITQEVSYTAKGIFVVDLTKIKKNDVIDDKENKILTIRINSAELEAIDIDPNKMEVGTEEGMFNKWFDIKLTMQEYNDIQKHLRKNLEAVFDTSKNGQEANKTAVEMVKDTYEPIIKAIDDEYEVVVEIK